MNVEYKNLELNIGCFDYLKIGDNEKKLVIIPGLSDGFMEPESINSKLTKKMLYKMCASYLNDYEVYVIPRKRNLQDNYSIKDMADDYYELIKHLKFKEVSVLGLSQGGMIAQHLALKLEDILDKLILVVTTAKPEYYTKKVIGNWIDLAEKEEYKKLMIDSTEKTYSEKYLKKVRLSYLFFGFITKKFAKKRFIIQAKSIMNFNALEEIKNIKKPTLIISGEYDKICDPNSAYVIHDQIESSKLHVFKNQSHAPFDELKKEYNDLVINFLRGEI